MNDIDFLNLKTYPARLHTEQAATYLGFKLHDITILIAAGLLRPLGAASPQSVKYFAIADLEKLRQDTKWLSRATDAIRHYWERKNGRRVKNRNGPVTEREQLATTGLNPPTTR
jgi:hypothetical protein